MENYNVESVTRMGESIKLNSVTAEDSSAILSSNISHLQSDTKNRGEKLSRMSSCEMRTSTSTCRTENRCVSSPVTVMSNVVAYESEDKRHNLKNVDILRARYDNELKSGKLTDHRIVSCEFFDTPVEHVANGTSNITAPEQNKEMFHHSVLSFKNNGSVQEVTNQVSEFSVQTEEKAITCEFNEDVIAVESDRTQTLRRLKSRFLSHNEPQEGKSDSFARFGVRSSGGAGNKSSTNSSIAIHKFPFAEPFSTPNSIRTEHIVYSFNTEVTSPVVKGCVSENKETVVYK